jgi:hypothetical protein
MNPADEMAAKTEPTEPQSAGAAAGSNDELDKQLRVSVEALLHPSPPPKPVEELDELISAISHHLDRETMNSDGSSVVCLTLFFADRACISARAELRASDRPQRTRPSMD